jgi:hypothetical protein
MIMAAVFGPLRAQQEQDLLSLLGREETTEYAAASFKTNRVINLHSLENTAAGVLDVKISHRFGFIELQLCNDESMIRIGAAMGYGRSYQQKK